MRRLLLPSISYAQLAASATMLAVAFALHSQTITSFDPPNSTGTAAVAINVQGEIAGTFTDSSVSPFVSSQRGFLRERDGKFTVFEPESSVSGETFGLPTWVSDISPEGEVVGFYAALGDTTSGFLRRKDGTIVEFGGGTSPASSMTDQTASAVNRALAADPAVTAIPCDKDSSCIDGTGAFAVNALGEITGVFGDIRYNAFLRQANGTTVDFNAVPGAAVTSPKAINLFGQITGFYADPSANHGFLRQPNGTFVQFDPPNSTNTQPQSINLFSQIAGYFTNASGTHGFVRQPNGKINTFDPPGSTETEAESINLTGEITGFYRTIDGKSHGFLRGANGRIETFDAPGAGGLGTFPKEINDLGEVVGFYEDGNSVLHGFVRSPRR